MGTKLVERILNDDFVWTAVIGSLSGRMKRSNTHFYNTNCPMCVKRGETADKKGRCGIKNNNPGLGISCFNCGFKTRWLPGELISHPLQDFLVEAGMDEVEVKRLNHKALTYRSMISHSPTAMEKIPLSFNPNFQCTALPPGAKSFEQLAEEDCSDPDFIAVAEYLFSRGEEIANATTYYWTPDTKYAMNRRVIIPFKHEGMTVGYTARLVDGDSGTRYQMSSQKDYLFNSRVMTIPSRKYIILVEGVFDALAIDGVSSLGSHLNDNQIAWLKSTGKKIILLPDRDSNGNKMIDVAIRQNWEVSFPVLTAGTHENWWDHDVKDAAEAVKRYGKLWTLLSIINSTADTALKINVQRKYLYEKS